MYGAGNIRTQCNLPYRSFCKGEAAGEKIILKHSQVLTLSVQGIKSQFKPKTTDMLLGGLAYMATMKMWKQVSPKLKKKQIRNYMRTLGRPISRSISMEMRHHLTIITSRSLVLLKALKMKIYIFFQIHINFSKYWV